MCLLLLMLHYRAGYTSLQCPNVAVIDRWECNASELDRMASSLSWTFGHGYLSHTGIERCYFLKTKWMLLFCASHEPNWINWTHTHFYTLTSIMHYFANSFKKKMYMMIYIYSYLLKRAERRFSTLNLIRVKVW